MYTSLTWVPRGLCHVKLPEAQSADGSSMNGSTTAVLSSNAEAIFSKNVVTETNEPGPVAETETDLMDVGDNEEAQDIADILSGDLDTLSLFKSNSEDPYLKNDPEASAVFDQEELDDLTMRPSDALIIAAKSGDDASVLEFHLLEDDPTESDSEEPYRPHYYIHHDVLLPTLPLCASFTSISQKDSSLANLVAVGCFTPGIDVWDVERVNILEPLTTLGGYERAGSGPSESGAANAAMSTGSGFRGRSHRGKSRKRVRLRLKEGSHADAVMSLSWNKVQKEYLASGSADFKVKVWDIESSHCARTLSHHSGKVQSVVWHPREESTLLTAAFDGTAQIVDVRSAAHDSAVKWGLDSDVEVCVWGESSFDHYIMIATEDGYVSVYDRRIVAQQSSDCVVVKWKAHEGAVTACEISAAVPGMLVTGSVDKTIKVWDASPCISGGRKAELLYERKSKAGAVFCASLCPTWGGDGTGDEFSPFCLAYGGAKGLLVVADLAVESATVRNRFYSSLPKSAATVIEKRVERSRRTDLRKPENLESSTQGMKIESDSDSGSGVNSQNECSASDETDADAPN